MKQALMATRSPREAKETMSLLVLFPHNPLLIASHNPLAICLHSSSE